MMNLHDGLAQLAGPAAEPTPDTVAADLARGRRALRRRRTAQAAAGSAFTVAAVAAAFAFATAGSTAPTPGPVEAKAPATVATIPAGGFKLVDYRGAQPEAFTVGKVPAGWEVQGVTVSSLTVGPVGMADKDPNSFVGKVAVMLQSADEHGEMPGTPTRVRVGDQEGFFVQRTGSQGVTLFVKQPNGINLEIQVWEGIDWTRDQIVAFAEGVHVSPDAKQGVG
ncbi:hypothetical protein [Actinoplanes utahensis]|uniref:Uncharacterized protein n=1 Tax=Actinoplanes utahensis TaxID=1869 RepID=A0A0A6UVX9_ACTUT|nr:hypothetical protein [Actinoplanes utahensis]KHD79083.1 hypothetical protein MB27_00045 [Actinoplanes utahensis]GIF34109.1 hypothetical protein Aut01nite_70950 [Actinoplanes utahensis]